MSHRLPPCDHDECGPVNCKRSGSLAQAPGSGTKCHTAACHQEADFVDKYGILMCADCAEELGPYTCGIRPLSPNTELSGGGPLSNKTTEAESRRPLE